MNEHDLDVQRRRRAARLPKEGLIALVDVSEVMDDGRNKHQNQSNNKDGNAVDSQVGGDRDDAAK